MEQKYFILGCVLMLLSSCESSRKQERCDADPDCVYVCSGPSAKRYHSVGDCKGLRKCSGEVLEMTVEESEGEGKTPCRICVKR